MFNRFPWLILRDGEPEGGGGGKPAFDPAAFQTSLMGEVNKAINGAVARFEKLVKPAKADPGTGGDPTPVTDPDPATDPKAAGNDKFAKELARVNARLEASEKARTQAESKAEEKDRHSTIKSELSKLQYAKPNGQDKAFKLIADQIKRNEDGSLETPDGTPLSEWITKTIETEYDELLTPRQVGGSGTTSSGKGKGAAEVQLEDIKPGMTEEQLSRVYAAITAANPFK